MPAITYLQLKPVFVNQFSWDDVNLQELIRWAHTDRTPKLAVAHHKVYAMKGGLAVPDYTVIAFFEWLDTQDHTRKYLKDHGYTRVAHIADPTDPRKGDRGKHRGPVNPWTSDHDRLGNFLSRAFRVPEEGLFVSENQLWKAAEFVVKCVGLSYDPSLSDSAAVELGCRHMKREVDDYAQLLAKLWRVKTESVMFTPRRNVRGECLRDSEGEIIARGVTVLACVQPGFYERFRTGNAEDSDIEPHDLLPTGRQLLVDAFLDIDWITRKSFKGGLEVFRTILYQGAAQSLPLTRPNINILTFGGTPDSEKVLRSFGYRALGTTTRLTGRPIYELTRPSSAHGLKALVGYVQYDAMKMLLRHYQIEIARERKLLT
jgi:hypothetical protein